MKGILRQSLLIFFMAFVPAGLIYLHLMHYSQEPIQVSEEGQVFIVKPGASVASIAKSLKQQDLIEKPQFFKWLVKRFRLSKKMQAGEYYIKKDTKVIELIQQLAAGQVVQHEIMLIPGWTVTDLLQAMVEKPTIEQTLINISFKNLKQVVGMPEIHPEGLFFPETYFFTRGTTDKDLLKRAYNSLQTLLKDAWQRRDPELPYENPYEALILASIIEKETALPEEYRDVAGVYVRRLKKGMRLQADPTVLYGLYGHYDKVLSKKDLQTPNPYNTYLNKGLPPTPIALASRGAILAALDPKPGKALYFVADGKGGHVFSDTLEQHLKAVKAYRRVR